MIEDNLISEIRKRWRAVKRPAILGIGDDAAALEYSRDKYLLWAEDMIVEGTHFKKGDPFEKIGRKAVAVNISDIAAMGGVPKYVLVSVGVPARGRAEVTVRRLYKGINNISRRYGIRVLGGDLVRSAKVVVDVSIVGFVEKRRLVRRAGAKPGDLVLITGPVRDGKKLHLDFEPRLAEARFLAGKYKISSMIDVSDGIAPDAGRIASESRVGIRIYKGAIPLSAGLSAEDALYYGESFELLFTMRPREARRLFLGFARRGKMPPYYVIGEIVGSSKGLKLIEEEGKVRALRAVGYRHF